MTLKLKLKDFKPQLSVLICIFLSALVILQGFAIHNLKNQKTKKYFLEVKLAKERSTYQSLQNLKSLMIDENVAKDIRQEAAKTYDEFTRNAMNEVKIESILQSKGFDNVICFIDGYSARVIIGTGKDLSKQKRKLIEETVYSVSNIRLVDIHTKK